jgi:glycosyltransferase involved in cell wall biosynthesis
MKILFLTQWFDPEPTFKGLSFARELKRRGHEVEVLTGFPNYPEGQLYPGYRVRLFRREVMEGIRVTRVALYPSHDRSALRRVLNYVSFALSAALLGPFLVRRADVAYVYHPPPTVGLAAILLKWFRGIPFVYDVQDLWPDTLAATGMVKSKALLWLVGAWCKFVYRRASKIVVLSPGFKRRLTERGVSVDKIEVIYNWCDEANIHPVPRNEILAQELGMAGKFNVVFAGNMGEAQALDTVLGAAELLRESNPQVQFVFVGGGTEVERLKSKASSRGLHNVLFLARRPLAEIAPVLSLADLLLVHLKDDPLFEITVPSKIQAYLSMGSPILAALRGDGADLVQRSGGGFICAPQDGVGLADAVTRVYLIPAEDLAEVGDRGGKYYRQGLSMSVGVASVEALLGKVIERASA